MTQTIRLEWQPYGRHALLLSVDGDSDVVREAMDQWLVKLHSAALPEGVSEWVPGFRSILFYCDSLEAKASARLIGQLETLLRRVSAQSSGPESCLHRIPVVYDGEDLAQVARQSGLPVEDVIALHAAPIYTVALIGFTPGFPYLYPLDPRLHLPRLNQPRKRVAAGSVAIGGEHAGIYSIDSPGGWHLLGRTRQRLFKPDDPQNPFLLKAGDRVQFYAVADKVEMATKATTS